MRTLAVTACCCVLVAIAGCGGSTRPSSAPATTSSATTSPATTSSASASGATAGSATTSSGSASSATAGRDRSTGAAGTAPLARYYGSIATFGSEASGSERAAVLAALHSYLSAIAAGNWGAACEQLSTPIQHQLELLLAHAKGVRGRGCSAALGALLAHAPGSLRRQQVQLNVLAVRVNSDRAFVLYRSPQLPHAMISMLREAGRWRAGVLAGSNAG